MRYQLVAFHNGHFREGPHDANDTAADSLEQRVRTL